MLDLIAFVDIHLRTYQVKVLVAEKLTIHPIEDIQLEKLSNILLDNIVLDLL